MDFDFAQVGVPFRMRPGLARMRPDATHLTLLRPNSPLYAEKLAVSQCGPVALGVSGFDPAEALATIRQHVLQAGVTPHAAVTLPLELQVEEDLAVLDTSTGRVPWMCVCVPSRWAPEEKLGHHLADMHAPVADGEALAAALPHLLQVLSTGGHWERYVWTISSSPLFDQHPHRQVPVPWPATEDPADLATRCWLRAERQTFVPLFGHDGSARPQVVFTIRVMLEPLTTAIRSPEDARRLHDCLASMSDAVLAYKNLSAPRVRLLKWLTLQCARADTRMAGPG